MLGIFHMRVTSFVAHRTGKIVKNDLSVFERGKYLLQNGIDSVNRQKLRWKVGKKTKNRLFRKGSGT